MRQVTSTLLIFLGLLACIAGSLAYCLPVEWRHGLTELGFTCNSAAGIWFDACAMTRFPAAWQSLGLAALGLAGLLTGFVMDSRTDKKTPVPTGHYGTARFASTEEMRANGFGSKGVVLCQETSAVLEPKFRLNLEPSWTVVKSAPTLRVGWAHVFCEAATGSGKGEGVVIPTLLSDTRSVVALDPKGNLYKQTSGWRNQFSDVFRLHFGERGWHRFNPLATEVSDDPEQEVLDIMRLVELLTDEASRLEAGKDSLIFWQNAALVLQCVFLHMRHHSTRPEDRSIPGAWRFISANRENKIIRDEMVAKGVPHADYIFNNLGKIDDARMLDGAFMTARNILKFCGNPMVRYILEGSDFALRDVSQGRKESNYAPVTLYMTFPLTDEGLLKSVARLMTNLLLHAHMSTLERRHDTLHLWEEFDSLGYLPSLVTSITKIREYGVQMCLIAQSSDQVEAVYLKHAPVILDNCKVSVHFGITGAKAADRLSKMIGLRTVAEAKVSTGESSRGIFDPTTRSKNLGVVEHGRALLYANEIRTMPKSSCLVFGPGLNPYQGHLVVRYAMAAWRELSEMTPPGKPARVSGRAA